MEIAMSSSKYRAVWLLAVVALTSAFWVSAITKTLDFSGAQAEVRGLTGLEPASLFAAAVIVTQLLGSVLLVLGGRRTLAGAAILSAFTLVATVLAHAWWMKDGPERARDFSVFFEHLGLIGGFVLAALSAPRRSE